jgi:hypothetical protein
VEGTISADSSSSLIPPVAEELAPAPLPVDGSFFCPDRKSGNTVKITPGPDATVSVSNNFSMYNSSGDEPLGAIYPEPGPENHSNNVGVSSDATVKGGGCLMPYHEAKFDLDFKAGWNEVYFY